MRTGIISYEDNCQRGQLRLEEVCSKISLSPGQISSNEEVLFLANTYGHMKSYELREHKIGYELNSRRFLECEVNM